jgi:hypothetical protein
MDGCILTKELNRSIGNQDIKSAPPLHNRVESLLNLGFIGDVDMQQDNITKSLLRPGEGILISIQKCNLRTLGLESDRGGQSNS